MKFRSLIPAALVALSAIVGPTAYAAPVDPYTENFATDAALWQDGPQTGFATWNAAGGPDGSSYISATMNTTGTAENGSKIVFRGQPVGTPPNQLPPSNGEFTGDWIAGGINHFSVYVYHTAPVALEYFARIAVPGGFPAVAAEEGSLVQPSTWTKLDYIIHPNQIGTTLTPEAVVPGTELATYNTVFSNVGRIQIGFSAPASLANNATPYFYAIDQVSVGVPEPGTAVLLMVGAAATVFSRRRRVAR